MLTLRELHRQLCSVLLKEDMRLSEGMEYIEPRINLQETTQYLVPGTAVCLVELTLVKYNNLCYKSEEWDA